MHHTNPIEMSSYRITNIEGLSVFYRKAALPREPDARAAARLTHPAQQQESR